MDDLEDIKAIRAALDMLKYASDAAELVQLQSTNDPNALRTKFVTLLGGLENSGDVVTMANVGLDQLISRSIK